MSERVTELLRAETAAPLDREVHELDVRELGPPEPLQKTLETLVDLENAVLVQHNDRAPQHLYPQLEKRGYAFQTVEANDAVITAIWEP